tara:strand:+ start:687 stop:1739 length:1053 start_codon:yes stop_codon:yes gene_type:complete
MNYDYFKGKKVLVTGHTGFKGSWLVAWLYLLKAEILGISLNPSTKQNHFDLIKKKIKIKDKRIDLKNYSRVHKIINNFKPDIIFHLAAQALVSKSYLDPKLTFETNTIGTLNILNSVKKFKKNCIIVIITSDKCYQNKELKRSYHENDVLGGDDFYSASKASSEILVNAFFKSFIKDKKKNIKMGTARAGNVVGGGDWSDDRLIPDCVKKWSNNEKVTIRNPESTRPWQHVLEALSGYLTLAYNLQIKPKLSGNSFNFSNNSIKNISVKNFLLKFKINWKNSKWKIKKNRSFHENSLLQLNSNKSKNILKWKNKLNLNKTISLTSEWYLNFYSKKKILTFEQLRYFMRIK